MSQLRSIWNKMYANGVETDKGSVHSYIDVYEELLLPYREKANKVLEIGIFKGNSMRMWEQYFTKAEVHGADCSDQPHGGMADLRPMIAEGSHFIHIMDATSELDIQKEFRGMLFDVIIDDGNHNVMSQLRSYELLSKFLTDGGIYIIEDIENIDETRPLFEKIDSTKNIEILDRRAVKNRFDDVMVIIKNK